ncbi:uncharacterized protein LOC111112524 [Crassostrea virginica]
MKHFRNNPLIDESFRGENHFLVSAIQRTIITGMTMLVCCGWTVFLCLSVQAYENLALHKPAWQSSNLLTNSGAERAVDGQYTNLSFSGGQCAVSGPGLTTDAEQTAEWRVDLGGVRSIHHIVIRHVTGNRVLDENNFYTTWFMGFSVHISNTTNKEDGVLCFRDTNYTSATIPNPVNITCPYHGRYVIYYNNRTHAPYPEGYSNDAWIRLCEVEVYGCPSLGFYGKNCSLECPQNCQDGYCDSVEGTCIDCKSGYIGPRCNQECPVGFYGKNCVKNCSLTCIVPGSCDKVTGQCLGGCQAGWTGDICEKECSLGLYGANCLMNCSLTCGHPGKCDRVTGHCNGGCQHGWTGVKCEEGKRQAGQGSVVNKLTPKIIYIKHAHLSIQFLKK